MEQKIPIITKKAWNLIRLVFFTLKKGISKRKFLIDLNMMMKHGKIATTHRHPHHLSGDYEFSCRNTPPYPLSLFSTRNKRHRLSNRNPPLAVDDDGDEITIDPAVIKVLNMMTNAQVSQSPQLLMKSPVVEKLKMTKSPVCEDGEVDEAAEKFIRRFYNDLRVEAAK
ncbi:hypothetical protein SSX86_010137 [Deinandra increscens subsp. villosa]|uniref:Avr9/Cf-9 rapidly elicited protein n=1 Tax=Deinandra increscens subsp. villosa TaxID=3103831 RepID=A0AAP0DEP7_9ASTR